LQKYLYMERRLLLRFNVLPHVTDLNGGFITNSLR
jgi:hypothetical protein